MSNKKLTDPEVLKSNHSVAIPSLLRSDAEITKWLNVLFRMRDAGEIDMTFLAIAEELSLFLDRDVTARQINGLFLEWQRNQRKD